MRYTHLAATLALAYSAVAAAEPVQGRRLAARHCTLCHVVGDLNEFGGIESTPSFRVLASMADGEARFKSFFARPPHIAFVELPDRGPPTNLPLTVPRILLTPEEIDAIATFAMSLKDPRLAQ